MMTRDEKMMSMLRKVAIANIGTRKRFKLAAAITHKRDLVSIGINEMRTHPLQKQFGVNDMALFLHAEISAIANALNYIDKNDLKKSTLYIHRVKRTGPLSDWVDGLACPCDGCSSAIVSFGIPRVIYSTNETGKYEEVFYKNPR